MFIFSQEINNLINLSFYLLKSFDAFNPLRFKPFEVTLYRLPMQVPCVGYSHKKMEIMLILKAFLAAIAPVCMINKSRKDKGLVKDLHLSLDPFCLAMTFPIAQRLASCVIMLFIWNSHIEFWMNMWFSPLYAGKWWPKVHGQVWLNKL